MNYVCVLDSRTYAVMFSAFLPMDANCSLRDGLITPPKEALLGGVPHSALTCALFVILLCCVVLASATSVADNFSWLIDEAEEARGLEVH